MIGMAGADYGMFDISELESPIEAGRCLLETARQLACLVGEVITVETIEPDAAIALLCEKRLPSRPSGRQRVRCKRLRHYHLRPIALPVAVQQHFLLSAFDIDL